MRRLRHKNRTGIDSHRRKECIRFFEIDAASLNRVNSVAGLTSLWSCACEPPPNTSTFRSACRNPSEPQHNALRNIGECSAHGGVSCIVTVYSSASGWPAAGRRDRCIGRSGARYCRGGDRGEWRRGREHCG